MIPVSFLMCWYFFTRLKYVSYPITYRGFWSGVYGGIVFLTLLASHSNSLLFGVGNPRLGLGDLSSERLAWYATEHHLSLFSSAVLALLMALVFYATAEFGAYVEHPRSHFIFAPGVLVACIVAVLFLTYMG